MSAPSKPAYKNTSKLAPHVLPGTPRTGPCRETSAGIPHRSNLPPGDLFPVAYFRLALLPTPDRATIAPLSAPPEGSLVSLKMVSGVSLA